MRKLSMEELNRKSVDEFKVAKKFPVIAILENIRSAYNVGSVLRTADAFLIESVFITGLHTKKSPKLPWVHRIQLIGNILKIQKQPLNTLKKISIKYTQ